MHSGAPAAAAASSPSIRQEASCGRPDLLSGACGGASTSRRSSSSSSNSGSNSSSISSSVLVRKSTLSSIIVVHDYDGRRRSSTMTTTTTTKRKGTTSSSSFESQTNDGTGPGLASPLASPSCATTAAAEATKTNGANSLVAAAAESLHESANEAGQWQVFSRAAANRQQPQQQQRQPAEVVATVGVESLLSSSRAIPTARATGNQRHNQQQSVAETDLANNCCGDGELDENEENAKFTFCSPTKSKQQQHQEQQQQRQRHQQERRQQQSSEREQGNMNRVSPLAARASNKSTTSNDYSNTEARYYHAKQVIVVDSSPDLGDDDDDDDVHNYAGYEANRTPTDYSAAPMDSSTATTSCYSPSASITQTNRANFYNNLFNQANDSAGRGQLKHNSSHSNYNNSYVDTPENILLFATEHYVGRSAATTSPPIAPNNGNNNNNAANGAERQQHQRGRLQQVGRGQQQLMTKSKSATLPNNNNNSSSSNFDLDYSASNYYEIKPTTATSNNNNNTSRGTTDGRHQSQQTAAIRSSTRSISSPRGGSIKLATKATTSTVGGRGGTDCNSQYGPLGSESQRASRLSLHATTPTRMGKFVNYYPATRQPRNGGITGSPSHKRHTSPYAFHVPLYRQQQQQQRSYHRAKSPLSPQHQLHYTNQPSVSYMYVNDGSDEQQIVLAEDEREAVSTEVKQPRYGYVAPIDRLESRQQLASSSDQLKQQQQQHQKQPEQLMPVGKFNKTLRSRTIAHIPGMVQVSVDDNCLQTQSPLKRQRQMGGDLIGRSRDAPPPVSRVQPLMASNSGVDDSASDYYYNAINLAGRSEGDLLKAHKIAWRHSNKFEFGYDNPFKPGTELSWEADLMVRLIKRGYPIDALPNLVQATKEVRDNQQYQYQSERNASQARSKSCDKLATSNDMRNGRRREQSDASPAEANAGVDARVKQQQQQNQKSGGYLKSNIRQFNKTSASGPSDKLVRDDSEEASSKRRTILDELEPCKRVWANSLSRAKSVPRFYSYSSTTSDSGGTSKPGAVRKTTVAGGSGDADSLDKLITSIEQEIGDLLRERSQVSPDSGIKATGSMSTNESDEDCTLISRIDSGGPGDGAKERPSLKEAIKSKKRPSQTMSGSKSAQSFGASSPPPPIATRRGKRNQKQDLTSSKSSNELLLISTDKLDNSSGAQSGEVALVRKKKSRCCMIQ